MSNIVTLKKVPYLSDSSHYFNSLKPLEKRVWLDSGKPGSHYGRFDIISAVPLEILDNPGNQELEDKISSLCIDTSLLKAHHKSIPFLGGAIGYYNYSHNINEFGINPKIPDQTSSKVGIFDWALIQDHALRQAYVVYQKQKEDTFISNILDLINNTHTKKQCPEGHEYNPVFAKIDHELDKDQYIKAIEEIKKYLFNGDAYQINFSQKFSGAFYGDSDEAYLALRRRLPSPYSCYLSLNEDRILCLSPEQFIAIENGKVRTRPIKGTASRGKNLEQDNQIAKTLINSDKNRAENLMIVDLLRNDLSKNCTAFSVKTPALFSLESYANVHHLVSEVVGELKPEISPLTLFNSCFPGGSITGAPKKRAMEIINELESHSREIYCGSVFYVSAHGKLDSNIAIRTALVTKDRKVHCWGGGGIVADSNPEEEYQESIDKVNLILKTLSGEK